MTVTMTAIRNAMIGSLNIAVRTDMCNIIFIILLLFSAGAYASDWSCSGKTAFFENGKFFYADGKLAEGKCIKMHANKVEAVAEIKHGLPDGLLTVYYVNGNIKEESEYKDGVKTGKIKLYYENGSIQSEITENEGKIYYRSGTLYLKTSLKNGLFDGKVTEFYEKGAVRSEKSYINGKQNGFSVYYFENGSVAYRFHYKNGKLEGTSEAFIENGKKVFEISYLNGEPEKGYCIVNSRVPLEGSELFSWQNVVCWEGAHRLLSLESPLAKLKQTNEEWICSGEKAERHDNIFYFPGRRVASGKCVSPDGLVNAEVEEGKLNGSFYVMYKNGKTAYETYYKNNMPYDDIRAYYENGNPSFLMSMEKGVQHGLYALYYADGQLKTELMFEDGKAVGVFGEYYPSGRLYSHVYFINGKAEGERGIYYDNGNPAYILNYKNGKPDGKVDAYSESGRAGFEVIYRDGVPLEGFCFDEGLKINLDESSLPLWQKMRCWDKADFFIEQDLENYKAIQMVNFYY